MQGVGGNKNVMIPYIKSTSSNPTWNTHILTYCCCCSSSGGGSGGSGGSITKTKTITTCTLIHPSIHPTYLPTSLFFFSFRFLPISYHRWNRRDRSHSRGGGGYQVGKKEKERGDWEEEEEATI